MTSPTMKSQQKSLHARKSCFGATNLRDLAQPGTKNTIKLCVNVLKSPLKDFTNDKSGVTLVKTAVEKIFACPKKPSNNGGKTRLLSPYFMVRQIPKTLPNPGPKTPSKCASIFLKSHLNDFTNDEIAATLQKKLLKKSLHARKSCREMGGKQALFPPIFWCDKSPKTEPNRGPKTPSTLRQCSEIPMEGLHQL